MEKRWLQFFIVVIFAYAGLILYTQPFRDDEETTQNAEVITTELDSEVSNSVSPDIPDLIISDSTVEETTPESAENPDRPPLRFETREEAPRVTVTTELASITFTQIGALPISWKILPSEFVAPVVDLDSGTTAVINLIPQVADQTNRRLPLELEGGHFGDFNRAFFEVEQQSDGNLEIVTFISEKIDDIQLIKTYTIHRDTFVTDLEIQVVNGERRNLVGGGARGWGIGWQGGFLQPIAGQSRLSGFIYGIVAANEEVFLKDVETDEEPREYSNNIAWAGQEKKYFTAVLIPHPDNPADSSEISASIRDKSEEYTRSGAPDPMSVRLYHPSFQLDPGENKIIRYSIFAGPKDLQLLDNADVAMIPSAPSLQRLALASMPLGQGWIRPISLGLLSSLRFFEGLVHNWGLAIIVLVLTVKILLYPLSHWAIKNQARTMSEQTKIKPFLDEINKKYKDDAQKKTQETMKLFREHNINPLGALRGCFPMLLQMPIFFGLYVALDQAVELRGQEFLWIENLAAPDRLISLGFTIPLLGWDALNILPILMAGTQFITTRMMMSNVSDPTQRQVMTLMPIMFTFILYSMPAGLMLYWTVQNIWQIGHTWLTKRYVATHDETPAATKPAKA